MNRIILFFLKRLSIFCALLCLIISCQSGNQKTEKQVAVTIIPQQFFAERIAGDHYKVFCMVPTGASPETYEPAPSQLIALSHCEAYLQIGYIGFETVWMDKLKEANPEMKIFNTSEEITLLQSDHDCTHHGHGHHEHAVGVDPHTWCSPKTAAVIVKNMQRIFIELDPDNEADYKRNGDTLLSEIYQTDSLLTHVFSQTKTKSFIIYHPTLTYLAHDYGLNQIAIEQAGKEPSPAQLKSLIEKARETGAEVVFVQKEFDEKNAQIIAQETGCRLIRINPLNYDWIAEMKTIATALHVEK